MMANSAGTQLRQLLTQENPLQIVGTINANHALLAKQAGFRAIYLSGGGVAAGSLGIPDLGITTLQDVLIDIERITAVCDLPLLVDIDTGFGASAFNIARTIRSVLKAGAAGVHMEDQVAAKRCGHRPRKEVVSTQEMVERIQAAVDAKEADPQFVIGARTDAVAVEGVEAAIARAVAYQKAGADFIFAEAVTELHDYQRFADALSIPILANITEFGQTPFFTTQQLAEVGVDMVLYPLSAFRAANKAALNVFETIRRDGSQANAVPSMQTREELYQSINYYAYEDYLNQKQDEEK
ncbi:methylisocitrate lyase [Sphingobacterium corticibacter]|uniref:2-methylisocitrate lyase n=1 Tax=Sphingobacterium corticibacter TaxID=2171749 RepID=A0A2T8HIU7_9SPHI|nr:methylisocitrate lyase [Sphingobacterium corticibacter]PVH25335.1 methylisocitrate lyase [Sphingobacterium corticibacter]